MPAVREKSSAFFGKAGALSVHPISAVRIAAPIMEAALDSRQIDNPRL